MGIQGLLQLLKPIAKEDHLSSFRSKRVAVDGSILIYRACYSSAFELNQGINTTNYLRFIDKMIHLLKHYQIQVYFVLDGMGIQLKKAEACKNRSQEKEANKKKARELLSIGLTNEARKYFSRAIQIDQKIIENVVDYIDGLGGVNLIVAPYEADAQIAYLYKEKLVDFVITEDSDLLIYGCDNLFTKITDQGKGILVSLEQFHQEINNKSLINDENTSGTTSTEQMTPSKRLSLRISSALEETIKDPICRLFLQMNQDDRIRVCLLAGSDYFGHLKGLGLRKSIDMVAKFKSFDDLLWKIQSDSKFTEGLPEKYKESLEEVYKVFKYQRVFDPIMKKLVTLNPLPNDWKDSSNSTIGLEFENAQEWARGELDFRYQTKREKKRITREEIMGERKSYNFKREVSPFKGKEQTSQKAKRSQDEHEQSPWTKAKQNSLGRKPKKGEADIMSLSKKPQEIRNEENLDELFPEIAQVEFSNNGHEAIGIEELTDDEPIVKPEDHFGFLYEDSWTPTQENLNKQNSLLKTALDQKEKENKKVLVVDPAKNRKKGEFIDCLSGFSPLKQPKTPEKKGSLKTRSPSEASPLPLGSQRNRNNGEKQRSQSPIKDRKTETGPKGPKSLKGPEGTKEEKEICRFGGKRVKRNFFES